MKNRRRKPEKVLNIQYTVDSVNRHSVDKKKSTTVKSCKNFIDIYQTF